MKVCVLRGFARVEVVGVRGTALDCFDGLDAWCWADSASIGWLSHDERIVGAEDTVVLGF